MAKKEDKREEIKKDLLNQLELKGMYQSYYIDMVEQYMRYYDIKNDLLKDIKENGVRIEITSGNGFTTSKVNESIMIVQKTTPLMLKILKDLGLEKPIIDDASDDEYL